MRRKMIHKNGYDVENDMRDKFKGDWHPSDSVDFQTEKELFEVKSCKLFVHCNNNNKKKCHTDQLGRFVIHLHNHTELKVLSEKENKEPKYLFVIVIEKQMVSKERTWAQVDPLIKKEKEQSLVRIKDVFDKIL